MTNPAQPILASSIWTAHQTKSQLAEDDNQPRPAKRRRLLTGCRNVDQGLPNTFTYGDGGLVCISSDSGAGGQELSHAILTSHLLSTPTASATIIDTQGLDIVSLFQAIKSRLASQPHSNPNLTPRDLDLEATQLLDRVRIMRVFDFEGMLEGIAELRTELESTSKEIEDDATDQATHDDATAMNKPRSAVPDSQAHSDSDDELLLSTPHTSPTKNTAGTKPQPSSDTQTPPAHLLLLSSLSTIFVPLQRTTHTAATSQLTTFLRSLRHTTLAHNLLTLILNSTQQPYMSKPSLDAVHTTQAEEKEKETTSSPSIFPSCTSVPSLGKTLPYLLDAHLLCHLVPKNAADARRVFGKGSSQAPRNVSGRRRDVGVEFVCCVEVLADKSGGAVGGFGFFGIEAGGVRDAF
ncbi:hypothetical protein MBLNU457_3447t1 [Dothideomycetes sp. NU457]